MKNLHNSRAAYGWISIGLHWVTAVVVIALFAVGWWMVELDYYSSWYQVAPHWHKSVGFLLVLMVVVRLLWRFSNARPEALPHHKPWEVITSKIVHYTLYALLLLMFPTGYLITTAKGQGLDIFNWFVIPAVVDDIDNLEDIAGDIHEIFAYLIIAIASFHAIGALKHHFIDRDETLLRMMRYKKNQTNNASE